MPTPCPPRCRACAAERQAALWLLRTLTILLAGAVGVGLTI